MQFVRLLGFRFGILAAAVSFSCLLLTGCKKQSDLSVLGTFRMGEKVQVGPLTYTVLEAQWKPSLNESGSGRPPKNRYLFVKVTATNSGAKAETLPTFQLIGDNSEPRQEVTEGVQDVPNWFGVLRRVQPAQTEQGYAVFDAPIAAYKLVISDGGEVGAEKFAHVELPVQLD